MEYAYTAKMADEIARRGIDCISILLSEATNEELCGIYLQREKYPEYASIFETEVRKRSIDCLLIYSRMLQRQKEDDREQQRQLVKEQQEFLAHQRKALEDEQKYRRIMNNLELMRWSTELLTPKPARSPFINCTTTKQGIFQNTTCW